VHTTHTHDGAKNQKSIFVRDDIILTSGFSKQPSSEYAVWDLRNMSEAVARSRINTDQMVVTWLMNRQHDVLYAYGKGSMGIGLWRFDSSDPKMMQHLGDSNETMPTTGFALAPVSTNDVRKHEINRGLRVLNNKTMAMVGFSLKNRLDAFQPELYPPHSDDTPSNNAADWAAGKDTPMKLTQFTEEDWDRCETSGGIKKVKIVTSAELKKENAEMKEQLAAANKRIAELEAEVASLKE